MNLHRLTDKQLAMLETARASGPEGVSPWDFGSSTVATLRRFELIRPIGDKGKARRWVHFVNDPESVAFTKPSNYGEVANGFAGATALEARDEYFRLLSAAGHNVLTQGSYLECCRCGKTAALVSTPAGALLLGDLQLPEVLGRCPSERRAT